MKYTLPEVALPVIVISTMLSKLNQSVLVVGHSNFQKSILILIMRIEVGHIDF